MKEQFDLVILGSGSTAFAAALAAQELGKTAVMTEERIIGGTCVNRGCLPSKNLIEAARLFHDSRNPRYPGLTPCAMEVDFAALIAQKDQVATATARRNTKAWSMAASASKRAMCSSWTRTRSRWMESGSAATRC